MLNEIREIVHGCMPYDTGNMFLRGARFVETALYYQVQYDLALVPYIFYQEEGTKFFDGNKGFISQDTVSEINHLVSMRLNGFNEPYTVRSAQVRQRGSLDMLHHGVIDEIRGEVK